MGYDLFPHKSGIGGMEPVALIGHNVCVRYANDSYYRRVIWFEPISPFQVLNIGAIAAGAVSPRTQALNLQLWRNEFGQFEVAFFPVSDLGETSFIAYYQKLHAFLVAHGLQPAF